MDPKAFTLTFVCTDNSGAEQKLLNRFFSKQGLYSFTSDEWDLTEFEFYVVKIESNFFEENETIVLTCQAKNPDFIGRSVQNLINNNYAAGASVPALSATATNTLGSRASVVVTISASTIASWNNAVTVKLSGTGTTGVDFKVGNNFSYSKLVMDSYFEVISGDAAVDPFSANFFQVAAGASGTWNIAAFANPISTAGIAYNVRVDLVALRQADTL